MFWLVVLCLKTVSLESDDNFMGSGRSLSDLLKLYENSDFIIEGQLARSEYNQQLGYISKWIKQPNVLTTTKPNEVKDYVLFGHKNQRDLPTWNNKYPLIVFGIYSKPNNFPFVKAVVNIKGGGTPKQLYSRLVDRWAEFDLDDAFSMTPDKPWSGYLIGGHRQKIIHRKNKKLPPTNNQRSR
ncbi:hypothetical protein RF11_11504 [Thelohanellus kitauei]|uniref:Uncharacterized protein n=1 Tax=Thelohanellus kitauei TaxID=669202 RepID=A0A0C2JPU8_THEKT|nr:hypothetical protein RF11_11504 [Thelohanellus kitauei]